MERHVLVVLAHPDDESFALGGTIARYTRDGVPVTYVCGTRGEMGRRMGNPPFTTRESLGALRERELREAVQALGVSDLRFLGLWDKTVEFEDREELAARICALIEEINPSLIYTFHPVHGGHPDHNAIGAATLRAVEMLPPGRRPPVRVPMHPLNAMRLGLKTQFTDISDTHEAKQAALRAHRSQTEGLADTLSIRYANDPEKMEILRRERMHEHYLEYPV